MLPLSDPQAVFMEGVERAARHWTAFFWGRLPDPIEWQRFGGHALTALRYCVESGQRPELAADLAIALDAHMIGQGNWREWEVMLSRVAMIAWPALDPQRQWDFNAGLSAFYFRLHRLEESIALAQRNYELAVDWGDLRRQQDALILQAEAYLNAEAWGQALRCAEDACRLSDALGDPILLADALIDSARALMPLGAVADAEVRLERALALSLQGGQAGYETKARLFLGHAAAAAGQWERALARFHEALAIVTGIHDGNGRAIVLSNIGRALTELGRYDEAEAALVEAAQVLRQRGNLPAEALARQRLLELQRARSSETGRRLAEVSS